MLEDKMLDEVEELIIEQVEVWGPTTLEKLQVDLRYEDVSLLHIVAWSNHLQYDGDYVILDRCGGSDE